MKLLTSAAVILFLLFAPADNFSAVADRRNLRRWPRSGVLDARSFSELRHWRSSSGASSAGGCSLDLFTHDGASTSAKTKVKSRRETEQFVEQVFQRRRTAARRCASGQENECETPDKPIWEALGLQQPEPCPKIQTFHLEAACDGEPGTPPAPPHETSQGTTGRAEAITPHLPHQSGSENSSHPAAGVEREPAAEEGHGEPEQLGRQQSDLPATAPHAYSRGKDREAETHEAGSFGGDESSRDGDSTADSHPPGSHVSEVVSHSEMPHSGGDSEQHRMDNAVHERADVHGHTDATEHTSGEGADHPYGEAPESDGEAQHHESKAGDRGHAHEAMQADALHDDDEKEHSEEGVGGEQNPIVDGSRSHVPENPQAFAEVGAQNIFAAIKDIFGNGVDITNPQNFEGGNQGSYFDFMYPQSTDYPWACVCDESQYKRWEANETKAVPCRNQVDMSAQGITAACNPKNHKLNDADRHGGSLLLSVGVPALATVGILLLAR
ncbi:hypothetical protein BESB_040290 [Besnoitia besnoiti]|uniref:Uncharacterized protein n=1 Tax=Besnoitia besnoiti TaxID=94643 RepID=A0A2A9MMD2_BESBE|nr:hypothetical protein BESB_040290 [Besnoitia besnoiti]PFH37571.1 hypothetical protein BESB_040290 [Besnoitia besnoiti]